MDEIKSLLKSILKGKTKEVDPGDLIIDWSKPPKAAGRDTIEYGKAGPSSPKQGRKAVEGRALLHLKVMKGQALNAATN